MQQDAEWVHRRNNSQETPLHVAAAREQLEVTKWLLDNGANVNATAYNGFTPLHLVDEPEVVELILEYKPNLSIANRVQGQTPLQEAVEALSRARTDEARANWKKITELYLAAGAEYDLLTAIELDDLEQVKKLYASGDTDVDHGYHNQSPLRRAASLGHLEICKYLIRERDIDDVDQFEGGNGYPIIMNALPHSQVVKLLIDNGADLETRITWWGGRTGVWIIGDEATALHFAADKGVPETITLLIDAGVDIFASTEDKFGEKPHEQTALDVAAIFGMGENAKAIVTHPKFLAADAALQQKVLDRCLLSGASPSWLARDADRPRLVEVLLKAGANANVTHEDGATPLQIAARDISSDAGETSDRRQVIDLLRKHGAKLDLFSAVAIGDLAAVTELLQQSPEQVNVRDYVGYPALHFAVDMNDLEMTKLLIDAGADVNIRARDKYDDDSLETALHSVAFWGYAEIAKILIDAGADVNATDADGSTPLHSAARLTNIETARLLLENGAKVDAKDADGETPLDWCRRLNWTNAAEMEKVLREYQDK